MNHAPKLTSERLESIEKAMGEGGSSVTDVSWNEYSSTFDSYVVEGSQGAAFVKFGMSYTDSNTGHRRGLGNELGFYEAFAPPVSSLPCLVASGLTSDGEEFLILEYVEGYRLEHDTRSDRLERAIVGLVELHDALAAEKAPPIASNLFQRPYFEAWAERVGTTARTWAHDNTWIPRVAPPVSRALARAAEQSDAVVHGELFANNVIIQAGGHPRFVDWDAWGRGPRVLDLAALTLGWPDAPTEWCLATYRGACANPAAIGSATDLHAARLFYGLLALRHRQGQVVDSGEPWLQDLRLSWSALEAQGLP
ncbi:MAG: aminoglycoside phosphotransferase family protein [Acidimicrobiia bacterium]|nr:aminoglycoside phosphotransferase family protein [Acidimicrobiia bacterium]